MSTVQAHVPCTHMCWPVGGAPDLPWAAYEDEPSGKGADDENWTVTHRWAVHLYEKYCNTALETALFDDLRGVYGYVEPPTTTWIDSEGCACTTYRFSEIERI